MPESNNQETQEVEYVLDVDPFSITLPQLAAVVSILGIKIPGMLYEQLNSNLKSLFKVA